MLRTSLWDSRLAKELLSLCVAIVAGTVAGAVAGALVASQTRIDLSGLRESTSTTGLLQPTSTFSLVPAERRAATPLLPPAFAKQRVTPVAIVYRKTKGTAFEDRLLGPDRMLGQAIALTSDGWFVSTLAVKGQLQIGDMVLWYEGASYPITQGVADRMNGTVFFKTSAVGATQPAFAHVQDFSPGAEVWVESRPQIFSSGAIIDLSGRISPNDAVSSEVAARYIGLDGMSVAGDGGAAVWDPQGSLIGVIASAAGEPERLIPATSIASSFSSLLMDGQIRHAALGVHAVDLGTLRIDGSRGDLSAMGALLRDDKKTGRPAVARDSAAAKAKLQAGDVILGVERDILDGTADLGEILSEYRPGTSVTLRVLRDGKDLDMPVTLDSVVTSDILK